MMQPLHVAHPTRASSAQETAMLHSGQVEFRRGKSKFSAFKHKGWEGGTEQGESRGCGAVMEKGRRALTVTAHYSTAHGATGTGARSVGVAL